MQYKIPVQIENEDTIIAWLSLRQLGIMMAWGGLTYGVFRSLEGSFPPLVAIIIASPFAIIGILIALIKVSEMTFLPFFLNFLRLNLNGRERVWSQGTDSYTELDIGYVPMIKDKMNPWTRKHLNLTSLDAKEKMKKL